MGAGRATGEHEPRAEAGPQRAGGLARIRRVLGLAMVGFAVSVGWQRNRPVVPRPEWGRRLDEDADASCHADP